MHQGFGKFQAKQELQQLFVTITLESECDSFPRVSSDESCKSLLKSNVHCHCREFISMGSAEEEKITYNLVLIIIVIVNIYVSIVQHRVFMCITQKYKQ